jgi:hypothetical protein
MSTPSLTINGWQGGLDNRSAPFALRPNTARNIVNCDVRTSGKIQRREGYAKLLSATNPHSLYSNGQVTLYVEGGVLKTLEDQHLLSVSGKTIVVFGVR